MGYLMLAGALGGLGFCGTLAIYLLWQARYLQAIRAVSSAKAKASEALRACDEALRNAQGHLDGLESEIDDSGLYRPLERLNLVEIDPGERVRRYIEDERE